MYFVMETENTDGRNSVDVVLEEENGFTFTCDCGDSDNDQAKAMAEKICRLLNEDLQKNNYVPHIIKHVNIIVGDVSGMNLFERKVARIKALRTVSASFPDWNVKRSQDGMIRLFAAKEFVEENWEWEY